MKKRFVCLWFPHLATDWFAKRKPELKSLPFVLAAPSHGKMIVKESNMLAQAEGVFSGMAVADARALFTALQVFDDKPSLTTELTKRLAEWSVRFTPTIAIDAPGSLILEVTGCAHLWGGEENYLNIIIRRFTERGYLLRAAMADTIGAAWAVSRFGKHTLLIPSNSQKEAILRLPVAALRMDEELTEKLNKLGLTKIEDLLSIPRQSLRRRFGDHLLLRIDQALGLLEEFFQPVLPIIPFEERLASLEPISTATGIEIALQRLLDSMCQRLQQEGKGLRTARFTCYRIDGQVSEIQISTNRPSHHVPHLFKLFEMKTATIEPGMGIELFVLDAPAVEDFSPVQEKIWEVSGGLEDVRLSELIDRIAGKFGAQTIQRFLPDEHYWPERAIKSACSLNELPTTEWKTDRPRPLHLLSSPLLIQVTAPIPDYPPMLFRYNGQLHTIKKADGPERIEAEWWLETGEHRDYYAVEDQDGKRYWLFRLGHYDTSKNVQWFLHGFFA